MFLLFLAACAYTIELGGTNDDKGNSGGGSGSSPPDDTGASADDDSGNADVGVEKTQFAVPAGRFTVWLYAHDVTGDGAEDLVYVSKMWNAMDGDDALWLTTLVNRGGGRWSEREPVEIGTLAAYASAASFADMDSDGIDDVAVGHDAGVTVAFGERNGELSRLTRVPGGDMARLAAGDVNGDGSVDLVGCSEANRLSVLAGDGSGSFAAAPTAGGSCTYESGYDVRAALLDFDGDGDVDYLHHLVNAAGGYGAFELVLNEGGRLPEGRAFPMPVAWEGGSVSISDWAVLQYPGEPRPTVVSRIEDGSESYLEQAHFPRGTLEVFYGWDISPATFDQLVVDDADGDGRTDIVALYQQTSFDERSRGQADLIGHPSADAYTWYNGEWEMRDLQGSYPGHAADIIDCPDAGRRCDLAITTYRFDTGEWGIEIIAAEADL